MTSSEPLTVTEKEASTGLIPDDTWLESGENRQTDTQSRKEHTQWRDKMNECVRKSKRVRELGLGKKTKQRKEIK